MCGGRGRRMEDLGKKLPKPLMKIKDQTILEIKINKYIQQGYSDIVLCIGYKGKLIKELIKKKDFSCRINFSDAGVTAGILKRLTVAKDLFDESVILTYGDTFADINLSRFSKSHHENKNEATIVVAPIKNPFGLVEYNRNEKITYFKEKPILKYYIGYAVINKSALEVIPKETINMPEGKGLVAFYKELIARETLGAYYYDGFQVTFNTESELNHAKEKVLKFYTSRED